MRAVWKGIQRTVFWSYERGTWPYDVLVGAIVLFVFFSPRFLRFNDKAQVTPPAHVELVRLQPTDPATGLESYRVDFNLLVPAPRSTELERRAHELLQKNVEELRTRRFQVVRIEPVSNADGTVQYYEIWVKR
jgi:hypothetical protein